MADPPPAPPPEPPTVFLSYSRNDPDAATLLRAAIERAGPKVFKDDDSTRAGELWLNRLQDEIERCGAFVVLALVARLAAARRRDGVSSRPLRLIMVTSASSAMSATARPWSVAPSSS